MIKITKAKDGKHKYEANVDGKSIKFGAKGYSDYTIHKDPKRKDRYIKRHSVNQDWSHSGIKTAGFWAKHLLWNKPTIAASIKDIEKNFNTKINKN